MNERSNELALSWALSALILIVASSILYLYVRPTMSPAMLVNADGDSQTVTLPYRASSAHTVRTKLNFNIVVGNTHVRKYDFAVDDCLDALSINGVRVTDTPLPYCVWDKPLRLDLVRHLRPGANLVQVWLRNNGGVGLFDVHPAPTDSFVALHNLVIILCCSLLLVLCAQYATRFNLDWTICECLFIGCALRILYFLSTSHDLRGHDTTAHIEYIHYVSKFFTIPPANEGWEYYQPPLYYFLTGIWMKLGQLLGLTDQAVLGQVQFISLVLSLLTFAGAMILWARRFSLARASIASIAFVLLVATQPAIIFFAARINNDCLAQFLMMAAIVAIDYWWTAGSRRWWILVIVLVGLGLLTKSSFVVPLTAVGALILLKPQLSVRRRLNLLAQLVIGVGLIAGWLPAYRLFAENRLEVIGNINNLHADLRVETQLANFITFNPWEVIREPYANPWQDSARRQHFWEYLFKSAFFGEFNFGEKFKLLCSTILVTAMISFLLCWFGILSAIRAREGIPVIVIAFLSIVLMVAHRILHPFSVSQDFRYVSPLAVCGYYLVGYGLWQMKAWLRLRAGLIMGLHAALCGLFILLLYFQ